jgi:GNAT superfamily N-acetyltransferase
MTLDHIEIRLGAPNDLRAKAAQIYYAAFHLKLTPVLGSVEHGIAILQQDMDLDRAIVALSQNHLLGIAGIKHDHRRLVNFRRSTFAHEFGWLGGLFRYLMLQFANRRERAHELLMDGIAVDSIARGKGIGTRLLNAVFDFARAKGYQSIRLDVVDTNPRARQLYDRMGFVPTQTQHYRIISIKRGKTAGCLGALRYAVCMSDDWAIRSSSSQLPMNYPPNY